LVVIGKPSDRAIRPTLLDGDPSKRCRVGTTLWDSSQIGMGSGGWQREIVANKSSVLRVHALRLVSLPFPPPVRSDQTQRNAPHARRSINRWSKL